MAYKMTAAHRKALSRAKREFLANMTPAERRAYRVFCRNRAKANWANPATREKMIEGIRRASKKRAARKDFEYAAKQAQNAARATAMWADPVTRARIINAMRARKGRLPPIEVAPVEPPLPVWRRAFTAIAQAIGL